MKNIIFDWSGVVKDAVLNQLWITNYIFQKFGVGTITLEQLRNDWEQPYMLFYKKYLPNGFSFEDQSVAYREAIYHKDCPKCTSVPEIVEQIKQFKNNGVFLTVVSSDLTEMLLPELEEYDLLNIFDEVVTDVHDKFDAVDAIIKKYNLNLEDTYFIGDSNHEIEVSKKAGIKSIAVTWGFTSEQYLKSKNPDYIVHNVEELEAVILGGI